MKKTKWIKKRHKVIRDIAGSLLYLYITKKYNVEVIKHKEEDREGQPPVGHYGIYLLRQSMDPPFL